MATPKACPQCGAPVTRKEMTVCWSCGTPYAFGEEKEKAPKEQRFAAAEQDPRGKELMARRPSGVPGFLHLGLGLLIGVLLFAAGKLLGDHAVPAIGVSALRWTVSLVALFLVVAGLVWVLVKLVRLVLFLRAETIVRLALVTRKATLKEGGKLSEAEGRPLLIHLEFRTENRDRVRATGGLAGTLEVGDVGVAYVRGPYLLDFQKLDV